MKIVLLLILGLVSSIINGQDNLDDLLKTYNANLVPYISVKTLASNTDEPILLDAREQQEFDVSHLKNALCFGYDNFDLDTFIKQVPNKDKSIVVYCSLGIRSEIIANKLKIAGYTKVSNLYGGIFEWKNKDHAVFNTEEKETDSVHVFSKDWDKWLEKGKKVYPKDSIIND